MACFSGSVAGRLVVIVIVSRVKTIDVALDLFKRHSGIVWELGRLMIGTFMRGGFAFFKKKISQIFKIQRNIRHHAHATNPVVALHLLCGVPRHVDEWKPNY